MLSLGLRRSDVFFGYVSVRPGTTQIKKLNFEESNHLDFGRETYLLEKPLVAMIVFLVFIIVAPVGIQLAVMGVCGKRDD